MPETLLGPSNILLYGRVLEDLKITKGKKEKKKGGEDDGTDGGQLGANHFLADQLDQDDAVLARIYGFSYEGHYYDLAKPAIFLVHGLGQDVGTPPVLTDRTGAAVYFGKYSGNIKVWSYDQGDFSIRLDAESGPLEEILIEMELLADEVNPSYSGAKVRGAKVRGAKVRGAKVRGAKVRGGWGGDNSD